MVDQDDWPAGRRWIFNLWHDLQVTDEQWLQEALEANKEAMPREVAEAFDKILRYLIDQSRKAS